MIDKPHYMSVLTFRNYVFHFYDVNAENRNWTDINEACGEILKALEQEPTDENLHREREQAYMQGYEDASKKCRQEPCEYAVSRQELLEAFEEWINDREDWNEHPVRFIRSLVSLPPVTPICKKGNYCPKCGGEMESEKNESGNS